MNKLDKLSRDAKILVDSVKDTLTNNIMSAIKTNAIVLDKDQLEKLFSLIALSSSEGYQKSLRVFQSCAKSILEEK